MLKFKPVHAIVILFLAVSLYIAFRTISDRRAETERKLKVEQQIADAAAQQKLAAQKFLDDAENARKQAAEKRAFNRFLYGTDDPPPDVTQREIEQHLRKLAESKER